MRLRDRVAIVTECGEGETYGVVWARALAREGAAVVLGDRDGARATAVAAELTAVTRELDRNATELQGLRERLQELRRAAAEARS